jgi:hypothetical protein
MKKIRGDEPIGVIKHTYKETPCIVTFISNKHKCHFFPFFFYKIREQENRRTEQVLTLEQGGKG